jgi:Bacterial mobilisation protein (MobC).
MNEITHTPQNAKPQNKGGRPKMDDSERKDHFVKVGFDAINYKKLKRRQRRTGDSLSNIVYELAVNGRFVEPLSKDVLDLLRKIAGMANNVNQMAHRANAHGYLVVAKENIEMRNRLDQLLIDIYSKL